MKKSMQLALIAVIMMAFVFSACASSGTPVSTEIPKEITPSVSDETPTTQSAPVEAAIEALARQLGIDTTSIKLVSVNATEWPNSCLGAPGPDEMCAEVITLGYVGFLEANGAQYEFRSDESSSQIRIVPGAVGAAQQALAHKLGVSSESVHLVSLERVMWNDSCLGVTSPKIACLDVLTPGYRVILQADGEQYVYHTDESGNNLVLAEMPLPGIGEALIVWSETDELGCQLTLIDTNEISFGACEGTLTTIPFPSGIDSNDLAYLIKKYATFEAPAAGGNLSFTGEGSEVATPAEQRKIAEWARWVRQIAESGRLDPTWGLALTWQREGGIAGFCDDLSVYVTGIALASSCRLEQPVFPQRIFLNADQLDQLYAWLDSLRPLELEQTDPGTADAMTTSLQFMGLGEEEASSELQQAILDFAAQVYTQVSSSESTD